MEQKRALGSPEEASVETHRSVAARSPNLLREACDQCSQALAAAAHDLKTPLAVLSGYIDILASRHIGPLTPRQEGVLKEMAESVERLKRFTNEFLNYYAVQAKVELQAEESDLNQCVADVVKMWVPQFAKKSIAFYWSPGDGLPRFTFDYHKVQHILSNLLDNAQKFTPEGGSVWVQTEDYFWERRTTQANFSGGERRGARPAQSNCALISVSDTGVGILVENYQQIFEEFIQIGANRVKGGGMGLGLAITKRLVELHRGKVWVESEVGKGSKFSVVLPFGSVRR
jgi:signal transduction histidine kinase